jgi:RecJ-like exonuclease
MIQSIPESFLEELKKAKELINEQDTTIRVISHYDADGICGAGILCSALKRYKMSYHATITRSLKDEFVQELDKQGYDVHIFCDMGSGQIESIERMKGKIVILDHHKPLRTSNSIAQVNPHFHGIDGTDELSGASLAFLFACELDDKNADLAPLSIAGNIGDKQHIGGMKGPNAQILKVAVDTGSIEVKKELRFEGKTIMKSLRDSLDPYICGISGKEEKTIEMLNSLNIDPESLPQTLSEDNLRSVISLLMVKLLKQGSGNDIIESIISDRYWLPKWNFYASDLSNYANACGRLDQMGTGVALCLGDEEALERAKKLRAQYKGMVREGLLRLENEGVHSLSHIQFFYTENPSVAGAHAGISMMYFLDQKKPVMALSRLEHVTKISSRGTKPLVSRGLDLAIACRKGAQELGGRGGGHPIASGASIPVGTEEKFLDIINELVKEQLST